MSARTAASSAGAGASSAKMWHYCSTKSSNRNKSLLKTLPVNLQRQVMRDVLRNKQVEFAGTTPSCSTTRNTNYVATGRGPAASVLLSGPLVDEESRLPSRVTLQEANSLQAIENEWRMESLSWASSSGKISKAMSSSLGGARTSSSSQLCTTSSSVDHVEDHAQRPTLYQQLNHNGKQFRPSIPLTRAQETQLIVDIFPNECPSFLEKRKRCHKHLWVCLKRRRFRECAFILEQMQLRQIPFDEISYNFAIYLQLLNYSCVEQNVCSSEPSSARGTGAPGSTTKSALSTTSMPPKRPSYASRLNRNESSVIDAKNHLLLENRRKAVANSFAFLTQMRSENIYHPTLLRLHANFLSAYEELVCVNATPNEENLRKVVKTFWEIALSFKKRRIRALKERIRNGECAGEVRERVGLVDHDETAQTQETLKAQTSWSSSVEAAGRRTGSHSTSEPEEVVAGLRGGVVLRKPAILLDSKVVSPLHSSSADGGGNGHQQCAKMNASSAATDHLDFGRSLFPGVGKDPDGEVEAADHDEQDRSESADESFSEKRTGDEQIFSASWLSTSATPRPGDAYLTEDAGSCTIAGMRMSSTSTAAVCRRGKVVLSKETGKLEYQIIS
ncbi:unnamed protein product [Amoebophrya sp. A120]|nr:unnamed protein product [Amoebophrya sp. A120]|eukprot:GSA120T00013394001.1